MRKQSVLVWAAYRVPTTILNMESRGTQDKVSLLGQVSIGFTGHTLMYHEYLPLVQRTPCSPNHRSPVTNFQGQATTK